MNRIQIDAMRLQRTEKLDCNVEFQSQLVLSIHQFIPITLRIKFIIQFIAQQRIVYSSRYEKEVLTNYSHSEQAFILCGFYITGKKLIEATVSEAGCSSGSVQDCIGGDDPALLCLLLKGRIRQVIFV